MNKIAIMGNGEDLRFFLPVGFDVVESDENNLKADINKLLKNDYAIIFLTEKAYMPIKEDISKYAKNFRSSICVIPVFGERKGIGFDELRLSAIRAIGADIFFGDE